MSKERTVGNRILDLMIDNWWWFLIGIFLFAVPAAVDLLSSRDDVKLKQSCIEARGIWVDGGCVFTKTEENDDIF